MNAKVDITRVFKLKKIMTNLRTVMLAQGVLWITASASLLLLPKVEITNVILMSALGILFVGWGLSVNRQRLLSENHPTEYDLEIVSEVHSKEPNQPSSLASEKLSVVK